jgi:uncharacterized protein (TIGR02266 family)
MGDLQLDPGAEKRRFRRVYFAFMVQVSDSARTVIGRCQRISSSGLYVYAPDPFPEGHTIRLRYALPGQTELLDVEGKVLRSRPEDPATGTLGGMLILLARLMPECEIAIREFVLTCILREREYDGRSLPSEGPGDGSDVIPIRFFGTDMLLDEYVVNISEGGAFVRTLRPRAPGAEVLVDLYLPGTERITRLNARVAWNRPHDTSTPGLSGMGLEFQGVPPELADALRTFVDRFGNESV